MCGFSTEIEVTGGELTAFSADWFDVMVVQINCSFSDDSLGEGISGGESISLILTELDSHVFSSDTHLLVL